MWYVTSNVSVRTEELSSCQPVQSRVHLLEDWSPEKERF